MAAQLFFDSVADLYESARPSYPDLLINDLLLFSNIPQSAHILDIGCGTGKSTEPFVRRLYNITAMDPGENMLKVCRGMFSVYTKIRYVHSDFESFNSETNLFDLIISGTAFHWVSDGSHRKLLDLLKPNGCIGIFWHTYLATEGEMAKAIDSIYEKYAQHLYSPDIAVTHEIQDRNKEKGIISWPGFHDWRVIRYYEDHKYSASSYIDLLKTYSTHTALCDGFYSAIQELINNSGGIITIPIRSTLCYGRRNDD